MLNETSTNEYDQNANGTQTAIIPLASKPETQEGGTTTQEDGSDALASKTETTVNQDEPDNTEFSFAKEFLGSFSVISIGRDFHVYDQDYWHITKRDGLEKKIYWYFNELHKYKKQIKEIKKIADAVKCLTYQESFPSYSGEGNVLNFRNKPFNPVTGEVFEAFSEEHYCLGKVDFDYDPKATCEEWELFLESIWDGCEDKDDRIKLLQEFMFLGLTNITKFEKMLFLYGQGSNGKSVILNVIRAMVGEHNVSQVRLNEMPKTFRSATLEHKLVNIESDAEYHTLNEWHFKSLVSGEHIEAENNHNKYSGTHIFKPVVTMFIATNVLPKVNNGCNSYYRRVGILEFPKIFSDDKQDKDLFDKLKKELSGITAWALKARERLLQPKSNLTEPKSSKDAKELYEFENNHVKDFVEEMVEISYKGETKTLRSVIYDAYCAFCKDYGYKILSNARFGRELKALGIETKKETKGRFYTARIRKKEEAGKEAESKNSTEV